jgi:transcriptional regulator with XRE-family HTH domain
MLISERSLGRRLRRWRILNRVKQAHAADLFGVNQSTISRWESGAQAMDARQRDQAETLLGARLSSAADAALARLVTHQSSGVHLICDLDHRLLALSATRRIEFGCHADMLVGQSLWPFITEELAEVEASLEPLGWFEQRSPPSLVAETGSNGSRIVPIRKGRCRLSRFILSDGTAARLIETIA